MLFAIAQGAIFAGPLLLREIVKGIECRNFYAANAQLLPEGQSVDDACSTTNELYTYAGFLTGASVLSNFCWATKNPLCKKWASGEEHVDGGVV